jgi:hypothetical protein
MPRRFMAPLVLVIAAATATGSACDTHKPSRAGEVATWAPASIMTVSRAAARTLRAPGLRYAVSVETSPHSSRPPPLLPPMLIRAHGTTDAAGDADLTTKVFVQAHGGWRFRGSIHIRSIETGRHMSVYVAVSPTKANGRKRWIHYPSIAATEIVRRADRGVPRGPLTFLTDGIATTPSPMLRLLKRARGSVTHMKGRYRIELDLAATARAAPSAARRASELAAVRAAKESRSLVQITLDAQGRVVAASRVARIEFHGVTTLYRMSLRLSPLEHAPRIAAPPRGQVREGRGHPAPSPLEAQTNP